VAKGPEDWSWSTPDPPAEAGPPAPVPTPAPESAPAPTPTPPPPGAPPPGAPTPGDPPAPRRAQGTHSASEPARALHHEDDFRRTVLLTIAGTILPGLGLIAARRRVIGWIILGLFVSVLAGVGVWAAVDLTGLAELALKPAVLRGLAIALVIIGVVWVGVVVATHLSLRGRPSGAQRAIGGVLVGILAFVVAAPMAVGARYSYVSADSLGAVFKSDKNTKSATRPTLRADPTKKGEAPDPWKSTPRLNILLLGGDAGPDRTGTRTDTVILASIDTHTGNTTLFSLPRNTARMPFPASSPLHRYYPNGFTNGDGNNAEYFLNAMYDNVPRAVPKNVIGDTDNLGADALKISVGQALGLKVDYYVLINLAGFSQMINALGGIIVNINTYIPIGGNTDLHIPPKDYLHPGPNQKLSGRSALWYARGRYGSDDFARMDRQRCVINAIIKQANPANMLARYEDIAKAGKEILRTDLPQEVLPLMVDLSLRVKDGNVRSIVFKHGVDGFLSPNPNFTLMRQRVKTALAETNATSSSSSGKPSRKPTESEDVDSTCAYQPSVAATSKPAR
jgi:polyisoprenyl-teichoic acid--peptidoglycan teichoic acid transferase